MRKIIIIGTLILRSISFHIMKRMRQNPNYKQRHKQRTDKQQRHNYHNKPELKYLILTEKGKLHP